MNAGDCFYIRDRSVDTHLWLILSDPQRDQERVLLVSVTTYQSYKEDVCLIQTGEHPRISRLSCIAYDEARLISLNKLSSLRDGGHLVLQPSISLELLKRIRDGVNRSTKIKYKYIEFLLEQGVIE